MEAAGVEVLVYKGDEISRKGDGGPTCLTRPVLRRMSLFELIDAGDEDALRDELERDPESASVRNADGLSPVLYALVNGRADLVDPILDANPSLDVFDAAAVGRTRGLEELLETEPALAAGPRRRRLDAAPPRRPVRPARRGRAAARARGRRGGARR